MCTTTSAKKWKSLRKLQKFLYSNTGLYKFTYHTNTYKNHVLLRDTKAILFTGCRNFYI